MKIYSSTETDFTKNGYGFLTDCISAYVEESLNGDYVLKINYPLNGKLNEYIKEDNIIKCNVGDNEQLFRIQRVNKDFDEIEVYATHITYDLLNNMLENVAPTNLTCQAFGQWLLDHTQFETSFEFESDINTSSSARYVRKNPIEAIMSDDDNSMLNKFGGEIERDNFTIKLLQSRGENRGVKLLLGKNITEIKEIVDITSMFTRIMPLGFDGLMIPEKYVDSPLINNYPTPRITKVEFSDIKYDPESEEEGVYTNIEDAYAALRNAARMLFTLGIDKPAITIKVDWLELSKTEQYKNEYADLEKVRLGDTLTANILGINYTTKCTKTTYNVLTDMIEKFEIGTIQKTIANTINQNQKEIQQINPGSILDEAKQDATNLINSALGGYIYLDYETGNLYIMDTDNPETAQKIWRWNLNGLGYSSTGINGTYGIAMTMNGQIVADFITTGTLNTSVINGYDSLTLQVQTNSDDIATIKAEISDIADITTSSTSTEGFIDASELKNIAVSNPIRVEIHPINTNISYLYPSTNTFPSDLLFPKVRTLKFTNTSTNEVFTYELPQNLLYYDENNYDTFVADYENDTITITKKCGWNPNGDGSVILLDDPVITTYSFTDTFAPHFNLTEGNYQVELPGYSEAYLFVRLMVLNAYTAQYATKVELNSALTLTSEQILSEVQRTYATKETTTALSTRINQSATRIDLTATDNQTSAGLNIKLYNEDGSVINEEDANITMSGLVKFTDLSNTGSTTINGSNITTGIIKSQNYVANTSGTSINLTNGEIDTKNFKVSSNGTITANNGNFTGNINGSTISGGTISGTTLTGTSISGANITTNTDSFANGVVVQSNNAGTQLVLKGTTAATYGTTYGSDYSCIIMYNSGTITSRGYVYAQNISSDKRKKKNIEDTEINGIDEINKIDIKQFDWKENDKHQSIGFIAQQLEEVNPDYVLIDYENDNSYYINESTLLATCIKAIQEQQKEIEELKERIEELKK